jgi:nicotinate-nucleotide pyrophosphorylase (carboxylating)
VQDLNSMTLSALWDHLCGRSGAEAVERALEEDGARCDITTQSCDLRGDRSAAVVLRGGGCVAGLGLGGLFSAKHPALRCELALGAADGMRAQPGTRLLTLRGPLDVLLPVERSLLNLLGIAVATASATASFVDAVRGTRAVICDTRKTIPGLRWLQKYAVRCGGGHLHRFGLSDAVLLKDNHLSGLHGTNFAAAVEAAAGRARAAGRLLGFVCAEVDSLEQLRALLALPEGTLDIVLLDNLGVRDLAHAVALRDAAKPKLLLEASGGVRLDTVAAIAASGVDRISVGAITHSSGWADVALDMID